MTIKKKLVFSNILMIVIPVIAAVAILGILLEDTGSKYGETVENMFYDQNGLYSAQSIVFAFREEFMKPVLKGHDYASGESAGNKASSTALIKSKKLQKLAQELADLGYHFSIKTGGNSFFDSITEEERTLMNGFVKDTLDKSDSLTMTSKGTSIIIQSFYVNKNKLEIAAIHTADIKAKKGNQSYLRKYIFKSSVIFILGILVVVVLMNMFLTWWISRNILIPLEKLSIGSHRIKNGELNFQLDYKKADEFGALCQDFDEMRIHLKDSVEERLRYERYRTELLSGISHDLRTPLTSIKGYAEGLMDGIADTPEKQKRYYNAIHIRANDMEGLVDNLSTYTHLENGQEHYDFKCVEFQEYLNKVIQEYQIDSVNNQVKIQCNFTDDKLYVNIDSQKMQRVILNIFSNSVKYRTGDTSVITVETGREDDYAVLRITDDGPGVNIDDLQHIFECFYRGDASRTRAGDGSGLGLSIVKQIVEGHNGKLKAENRGGLSIIIWIPFCENPADN